MSNLLKKLESKAIKASADNDSSNTHDILAEIKSVVQSLSSSISDSCNDSERTLTMEKLLVKMYDAIERRDCDDGKNDELIELQKSFGLSNEIIISLLKKIIDDESRQSLLVQTIGDAQRTTAEMCGMIENSIATVLSRDERIETVVRDVVPSDLKFHVVRDERGDMSDVIVTRH